MDTIREYLKKPLYVGLVALVLGIFLGILYGWVIDPVEWTDAAITHLRADLQEDYLRMAIDSYAQNMDASLAKKRYQNLGAQADDLLAEVFTRPEAQSEDTILAFQAAVEAGPITGELPTPTEGEPSAPAPSGRNLIKWVLPIMCGVTLLIALGVVYLFFIRPRGGGTGEPTPAMQAQMAAQDAEMTDYASIGEEPPVVQFMASYKVGDDIFDDSFSIDSPSGEFLGECGVGISETVGVGEPKKVSAFEVWLFDKNDIQTVTKVLMSAHAFLDEVTRQRLVAKGEPVLAEPGTEMVLDTNSLRLVARVVGMEYGEGASPEHSFFDQLILELAVWAKPQPEEPAEVV